MTQRHILVGIVFAAALASAVGSRGAHAEPAAPDPLVIVVHPKSTLRNIGTSTLRELYRDSSGTVGGRKLIPLNLPAGSKPRRLFDRRVHGWSASEAARYWTDRKIRGGGLPPKELASAIKIQMLVFKYPNVIGYVPASEFRPDKLRALTVDGHAYDSETYPLR